VRAATRKQPGFHTCGGRRAVRWAAFDAQDYFPFNDDAKVEIRDGNGALVATPWYADVAGVGDNGDGPWTQCSGPLQQPAPIR